MESRKFADNAFELNVKHGMAFVMRVNVEMTKCLVVGAVPL